GSRAPLPAPVHRRSGEFRLLVFSYLLDPQLDTATGIPIHNLDASFVAFLQRLAAVFHAVRTALGNVNQTVFTRQNGNECTEVNNTGNFTLVEFTYFSFCSDAGDQFDRLVTGVFVFTVDTDAAIVVDINGGTAFLSDGTDGGTTFTNHFTNLVRIDFHRSHGRCVLGYSRTRSSQHLVHFAQDVQTCF